MVLGGCSVTRQPSLYTHDELVTEPDTHPASFVYHFYWVLPQIELRQYRHQRPSNQQYALPPPQRHRDLSRQSADSELKLRLEDAAIVKMRRRLSEQNVCKDGHVIDHVRWYERSMEIHGDCVSPDTRKAE